MGGRCENPLYLCIIITMYWCTSACIGVQVYRNTNVLVYRIILYRCPDVLEYRCTGVPVYPCTGVLVHQCIGVPVYQCTGVPVYHESKPKEVHAQNVCRYLLGGGGEEFKEQLFFDFGHCRPQNIEKTIRSP